MGLEDIMVGIGSDIEAETKLVDVGLSNMGRMGITWKADYCSIWQG